MAKVAITEQYLTDIADAIRSKTGMSSATYYPSEMAPAIMTISGSGGITPTGTISITENGTYNVTQYASASVSVPTGSTINNQDKSVTPTESVQTITYDNGYTGLGEVSVGAISSTYVGSGITKNPTPTVSDATVTIPAGYYSSQTTKSVSSGSAGTPTATKGTVSNNSISITPSVINTTGYISGSTINGTAITVSANELVSGNKSITENGNNIDVTNYATVSVNVPTSASAISIVDTTDANGGTIREITAVDISDVETALGSDGSVDLDDAINALTTYANETTGASDTNLSGAVGTLVSGYGQGGGSSPDVDDYFDTDISNMTVLYSGENFELTGQTGSYIDTEIKLFSEENIGKDFKIIIRDLYADNSIGTDGTSERCWLGAMYEVNPWPGIVGRAAGSGGSGQCTIASKTNYAGVVISRSNGVISFDALLFSPLTASFTNTGGNQSKSTMIGALGNMSNCDTTHDTTLTFGCEKNSSGTPYRYCYCKMGSIVVAMGN